MCLKLRTLLLGKYWRADGLRFGSEAATAAARQHKIACLSGILGSVLIGGGTGNQLGG